MTETSLTLWNELREDALPEKAPILVGELTSSALRTDPKHILFTLARYKHAAKMLPMRQSADVLELGCGDAFGTSILAQFSRSVTAVDGDTISINDARRMPGNNITFLEDDFLGKQYGEFDAVVSLDVIEHIPPSLEDVFWSTITKNLRNHTGEGMSLIGTPNISAQQYAFEANKQGHVNLFSAERLYDAMHARFFHVVVFGINDEILHTGYAPMCHYLLAAGFGVRP